LKVVRYYEYQKVLESKYLVKTSGEQP